MGKLTYIDELIAKLKNDGVYRVLPINEGACDHRVQLNGREIINLSANNYLGFATHPTVKEAAKRAIDEYGVGAGSVRTIVGNQDLLEQLEQAIAVFKHEEAVTVFQSGLNCNIGVIQAITDKGDLIVSDELNHASIIDGVRLSKADRAVYKHCDMVDLERVLSEQRKQYRNVLIITDGVFSMDGDLAPLPKIVELAERFDCLTYVDDAHGSGVLGENGRGTVDHFHLHGKIDFVIGTLSKAIGVVGGYVCSKQNVKEWLLHRARPLLFSTAIPPASIAAITASFQLLTESNEYTKQLWDNARYFKTRMKELGFDIGKSETPITPVMIGNEALTMRFSKALLEQGVFVSGIVFPTVALGKGRLRVMISASHTKADLDEALLAFAKVGKALQVLR
jgi:glycine C-acetyltransferase